MPILVMESSTASAKAMLYDMSRGVLDTVSEPYYGRARCAAGAGTQDAESVLLQTAAAARTLATGHSIEAVVPCGTWHNLLLTDPAGRAAAPGFTWESCEGAETAAQLRADSAFCRSFYRRTGCMVHATYPAVKLLHLREQGLFTKKHHVSSQSSYMVRRLTGEDVTTVSEASGSGLLNIHDLAWDAQTLELLGLDASRLPRLTDHRETLSLCREGAALLGLPAGTPVLPNHPDGALNQVGAGALRPGVMTLSVGTSAAMRLSVEKPVFSGEMGTWCYLSPAGWLSGAAVSGACNCQDWFRDTFAPGSSHRTLDEAPVEISGMPWFFPFLHGERCPGWRDGAAGAFLGLRPEHGPPEFYRAVQEGVMFQLYLCYELLCRENGPPGEIQLSGGITRSRVWSQMCCDIFGREMVKADLPHASMLGGAVLAMETLYGKDIRTFCPPEGELLQPDAGMHEIYQKRYLFYRDHYEKEIF